MLIDEITFGSINGGSLNGAVGFEIHFTGEAGSPKEVTDALIGMRQHDIGKRQIKGALLRGIFNSDNMLDVLTFVEKLKGMKYLILAIVDGERFFPWMKDLDRVIVETEDPEWMGFEIHELWYKIYDENSPMFVVPDLKTPPMLYVKPDEGCDPRVTMRFIKSSHYMWNLWAGAQNQLLEIVSFGEDGE